jgi:predicted AAA+ superfamily ATPase
MVLVDNLRVLILLDNIYGCVYIVNMSLKRNVYQSIIDDIKRKEVSIIIGPRQVGKTTLLKEVFSYCTQKKVKCIYYNLEMPHDLSVFGGDLQKILDDICTGGKKVVMIDEFHYLPNATRLFKAVFDGCPGIKIFASGSSALEMHKHMKESLAGRRILNRVFPLSFSEWLPSMTRMELLPEDIVHPTRTDVHKTLKKYLDKFLIYGGMPGLVHEKTDNDKKRLLIDLVATYIQKDVKALLRDEDVISFNRLLSALAAQDSGMLSENGFSGDLNYSLRQVRKDITILNQMFLIYSLKPFSSNRGRELRQTNKTYLFDSGIRNAILNDFRKCEDRQDRGAIYESFVFLEMHKNLRISQKIYYWRTRQKEEVDFVLVTDRIPLPVEVKSKIKPGEIPPGIKRFLDVYPECNYAIVLNTDYYGQSAYKDKTVFFVPHYYAALIPEFGTDR